MVLLKILIKASGMQVDGREIYVRCVMSLTYKAFHLGAKMMITY